MTSLHLRASHLLLQAPREQHLPAAAAAVQKDDEALDGLSAQAPARVRVRVRFALVKERLAVAVAVEPEPEGS